MTLTPEQAQTALIILALIWCLGITIINLLHR